jgi:plasmid stabilization system protein ParE
MLRELSSTVLRHPVAAQAFVAALVAEGRRFARTPEGQRWRASLRGSELVRGGQAIWEGTALSFLAEDPSVVLPSRFVEAVVQAASQGDLHDLLMRAADGEDEAPSGVHDSAGGPRTVEE